MSPAPIVRHQDVIGMLLNILDQQAARSGGKTLLSPVDVVIAEHSVVQPDLVYLTPDRRHLVRDRVEGVPDLLVEVLSPGSERRDRSSKLRL